MSLAQEPELLGVPVIHGNEKNARLALIISTGAFILGGILGIIIFKQSWGFAAVILAVVTANLTLLYTGKRVAKRLDGLYGTGFTHAVPVWWNLGRAAFFHSGSYMLDLFEDGTPVLVTKADDRVVILANIVVDEDGTEDWVELEHEGLTAR